jgi:hypothetical protein
MVFLLYGIFPCYASPNPAACGLVLLCNPAACGLALYIYEKKFFKTKLGQLALAQYGRKP